jgi:integrase
VKQHLAALRMLFDWLVTGHVLDTNPAHAVRGPRYVVTKGKTPVLAADEARQLLDSIDTTTLKGLRDRALIGVMVYTFARVNAVLGMKVKDYYTEGRRGRVRLHEKGGKEHDVPCHHTLEQYLDEYIAAAAIAGEPEGWLFRTTGRKTGLAGRLYQQDAYRMIQRQVLKAGLGTRAGNHTFRATGITPPTSRTAACSSKHKISPTTPPRARRSSTTAGRTRSRSTRWRRFPFDCPPSPQARCPRHAPDALVPQQGDPQLNSLRIRAGCSEARRRSETVTHLQDGNPGRRGFRDLETFTGATGEFQQ